ncbi:putative uncharacterized protein DDB_G0282133 [Apis dorsata]|uniref:putative uncharacterized protein DDB_G0282133 n=1 Tax=Apis dorsata TaxID=7462 RepID=UPI0003DF7784|nr:putative uncharacterized protein DDB_G0282133 [Apis dorsata]
MEDDIDIYEDLPSFRTEFNENFVTNNEENIVDEHLKLKKQITELKTRLENFQKINENLEINLFSLLKTAKAEIARKDKMIDQLRKKLDDATFKRDKYSKTNDCIIHKSTFRETIVNTHHKSTDIYFPPNEKDIETLVEGYSCNQTKNQRNKSALIPITVFGERLVKRMTDEQNLEKKDKQSNKLNNSNNEHRSNKSYIVKNNKENGFLNDTNSYITKETESSIVQDKEIEYRTKSSSRNMIKDTDLNDKDDKNENSRLLQKTIHMSMRKRTNEEINKDIPIKRIKSTRERYCFETMRKNGKKETNNIISESKEKSTFPLYNNFESSTHFNEKQHNVKNVTIGCTHNSRIELKKHENLIDNINKDNERKNKKRNEKKNANEHSTKQHIKSTQNSTFTLDEKNIGYRCIEVFEKDNYRSSHSKHHRDRQRGYHHIDNHRSRVKSTAYIKSSRVNREEKFNKNQYNNIKYRSKNIENIENIEKFISDSSLSCKKISTSNTIHALNDSQSNSIEKKESINILNDFRNYKEDLETYLPVPNINEILLFDKNQTNKEIISNEKLPNTSILHISENNFIKNKNIETQIKKMIPSKDIKNILQDNKDIELNFIKLMENNYLPNNIKQQALSQMEMIDHSLKNTVKDNVLQNSCTHSTILFKSPKEIIEIQTEKISSKDIRNLLQNNKSIELNSIESKDNYFSDNSKKRTLNQKTIDHSLENTVKNNVFQNFCSHSTVVLKPSKEADKEKNNYISITTINGIENDIGNNHNNYYNDYDKYKTNQNNSENVKTTMKTEYENTIDVITEVTQEKECVKYIAKTEEVELKEFRKPLQKIVNNNKNTRVTSMNIHGKIIVFARRKKPVCLANSNANMTVLINNKYNINVDLPSTKTT